jgi:glycosyltransferase involved in cell wall biosynthesis
MKIVHIITSLLDGGAEGVLYRLCCYDQMNEHVVISLRGQGKYGKLLSNNKIKIYTLNMEPGKLFRSLLSLYKLIKIIKIEKADIVQTWLYHADFFGGIAARLAGVKNLIWNVRHSNFNKNDTKKNLLILIKVLAKLSYFLPKKIIFCSIKSMNLHNKIGYQSHRMEYVPNGYDLKKFKPNLIKKAIFRKKINLDNRTTLFGNVARFHPQKDHKNLLEALSILKKDKMFFKCVLVGFGITSRNNILVKLIKKFKLTNEIILLGPQKDINLIMNGIDIHILASQHGESFPNVVGEAMASGTPCVVTDVGDSSLIVGKTGWVAKHHNSSDLSNNIKKAVKKLKSNKWQHHCLLCRERINNKFTLNKMVNGYNNVWNSINKIFIK